jgi:hypothetical protein
MPLEFSEYVLAKTKYGAMPQLVQGQEIANQAVAIGATSAVSAAFNARTHAIVISKVDADARIAIGLPGGSDPVAVSAGAGQTRYLKTGNEYAFAVEPGQKIAVIQA